LIVLLACVAWLYWRVAQLVELRHWRGVALAVRYVPIGAAMPRRRHPARALIDPVLSLGIFISVPYVLGTPVAAALWFAPEVTDWLVIDAAVAVAVMIARLTLSISR
jgi:hypothetical protein